MTNDKVTYITYSEGLEAKHLHLGNLVHDHHNPNALDPHVEKAYTDLAEVPPFWAEKKTMDDFALTLRKTSTQSGDRYQVVAAEKTIKLEIKDPEIFFQKVTLASPDAKKWLTSHLSAADTLIKSHPPPQIWLLTGLILMTHATWSSLSSSQALTPGLPAPFKSTDTSKIRRLSVSEAVKPAFGFRANEEQKHVGPAVIHETGKYPGLRGWAARWVKVDVEVKKEGEGGVNEIQLKSGQKVALLELDEDEFAENGDEEGEDLEDEYWDKFLEKADEFL